jgi:protein required for attachment to host cells
MTTRILVAHGAGARMFDHHARGQGLQQVADIPFEDGRLHVGDFETDKPGRSDHGGQGHGFSRKQDSKQHAQDVFALQLITDLTKQFQRGEFKQLIMVAPPRLLGRLRDALGSRLDGALLHTLAKDLPNADATQVAQQLAPNIVL